MISRISLGVAGLLAAIALPLSACGGGTNASVSARDHSTTTISPTTTSTVPATTESSSTVPPASSAPSSTSVGTLSGFKAVEFRGVRFQVPDDWPIYDLAKDPTRCVRFDQHAVYLGHAGADQNCPAHLVGRTNAVQVEPIDATSHNTEARATAPTVVNGLQAREDPSSAVKHSIVAAFDGNGVVATVTFQNDDSTAQQILGTFERAGG